MFARDQSNPEKTGTATVRINVLRSNSPPVFVNGAPYNTAIDRTQGVGTTIYTQSRAVDQDIAVSLSCLLILSIVPI